MASTSPKSPLLPIFVVVVAMLAAVVLLWPKPMPHPPSSSSDPAKTGEVLVYFVKNRGGEVVSTPVKRKLPAATSQVAQNYVTYAIIELLKGPNKQEMHHGYFSEIPKGTRLLSVYAKKGTMPQQLVVDVSAGFTEGGGSNSMSQRLEQIQKTAVNNAPRQSVYLYVSGEPLKTLGGEGVEVPQPLSQN